MTEDANLATIGKIVKDATSPSPGVGNAPAAARGARGARSARAADPDDDDDDDFDDDGDTHRPAVGPTTTVAHVRSGRM